MMQEATPPTPDAAAPTPDASGGGASVPPSAGTEEAAAPAAAAPAEAEPVEEEKPKGSPVLIVEDDTFLVRAYEVMLSSQGFNVSVVTDGEAALEALRSGPLPAVMLLDLMLPKLSGFEVLEQIQQDKKLQQVPVIVLSNLGQPDDIERAKALGAKDYFVKADTPLEKVVSVINQFLAYPTGGSNLAPILSNTVRVLSSNSTGATVVPVLFAATGGPPKAATSGTSTPSNVSSTLSLFFFSQAISYVQFTLLEVFRRCAQHKPTTNNT